MGTLLVIVFAVLAVLATRLFYVGSGRQDVPIESKVLFFLLHLINAFVIILILSCFISNDLVVFIVGIIYIFYCQRVTKKIYSSVLGQNKF